MVIMQKFRAGMALLISSLACLHKKEVFKSHLSKYLAYWLFPLEGWADGSVEVVQYLKELGWIPELGSTELRSHC